MVPAERYSLKYDREREGFVVQSWQQQRCPNCSAPLSGYDLRRRKSIDTEGRSQIVYVRRLRCAGCGRLHTEIPDFMLPYKQYTKAAVEEGKTGGPSCCPADASTIRRWKK